MFAPHGRQEDDQLFEFAIHALNHANIQPSIVVDRSRMNQKVLS
jgi:hypothetical protein